MYVVVFKAKINVLDDDYAQTAQELRDRALKHFGCVNFQAVTEGDTEIALSYWNSLDDIKRWKNDPHHLKAQRRGKAQWYKETAVEVCQIVYP